MSSKEKSFNESKNRKSKSLSEFDFIDDVIMLRLQLPQDLFSKITLLQERLNLQHSVSAIRYLIYRGLTLEELIDRKEEKFY